MKKVLSPGVQDGKVTDFHSQVPWVGSDRAQRLIGRSEEQVVDDTLVLQSNVGNRVWKREHDVEVLDWQQLGFAGFQPAGTGQRLAFRAVPIPARVVRDALMSALVTLFDMTAQGGRAALLKGARNHTLLPRNRKGFSVRCRVQAKHIPHFKERATQWDGFDSRSVGGVRRVWESV